jgi:hypothetical protein
VLRGMPTATCSAECAGPEPPPHAEISAHWAGITNAVSTPALAPWCAKPIRPNSCRLQAEQVEDVKSKNDRGHNAVRSTPSLGRSLGVAMHNATTSQT